MEIDGISDASVVRAGKFSAVLTRKAEVYIWGVPNQTGLFRVVGIKDTISDIGVGGHSVFCLTNEGGIYS